MDKKVVNLSGGKKQLFLKEHRAEIKAYYARYGAEETCRQYNMKTSTLESFLNSSEPLSRKDDRAVLLAQIANERSLTVLREIDELKRQYSTFVDSVSTQITDKFFKPLLQSKLEIPPGLEVKEDARLRLDDVGSDYEAK